MVSVCDEEEDLKCEEDYIYVTNATGFGGGV